MKPTYEPFHVERINRVGWNETGILLEGMHQVEETDGSGFLVCPVVVARRASKINLEVERFFVKLELQHPVTHLENACIFRASTAKPRLFFITKVKMHCNALDFNRTFSIQKLKTNAPRS